MWHNAIVAIALFVLALFDGSPVSVQRRRGTESIHRERELYGRT